MGLGTRLQGLLLPSRLGAWCPGPVVYSWAPGPQPGKSPFPQGPGPIQGAAGLSRTFLTPALVCISVRPDAHTLSVPGLTFFRLPLRVPMKTTECCW